MYAFVNQSFEALNERWLTPTVCHAIPLAVMLRRPVGYISKLVFPFGGTERSASL